tara:strand:- start:407 stop:1399 length:993 start_codon:yes stop_codon:yes gene_type:complete
MIYKSYLVEGNINKITQKIILFYGENFGLKNTFKNEIKSINSQSEVLIFQQEEIKKNNKLLLNEITDDSLFQKDKIIIIYQVDDKIYDLVEEVREFNSNQKIFLFADILDKRSKLRNNFEKSDNYACIACYNDNELTIKKLIFEKLKGFTGLTPENLNTILDKSNLDRVKLDNEINKIYSFYQNKKIETNSLNELLDTSVNDDFNILKDEALKGDKIKTNKMLRDTIIEPDKNIFYLNQINLRLTKLLEINKKNESNKNLEKSISDIKPPVFWKDKPNVMAQAKKWHSDKIRDMLNKTHDLELKIKSNSLINKDTLLKNLIVDICNLANS